MIEQLHTILTEGHRFGTSKIGILFAEPPIGTWEDKVLDIHAWESFVIDPRRLAVAPSLCLHPRLAAWATLGILCMIWACDRGSPSSPAAMGDKPVATPAAQGLDAQGQPHTSTADRCAVCGMSVAMFPKFASAIETQDKKTYYFCNPGCMLRAWTWPERHLGHANAQLSRAVVPEYFDGRCIDATRAHFVSGSDVLGPMGPAPVPLATEADAETFRKRHGGNQTFRLGALNPERWETLVGKPAHPSP
ncbi:MAG: nitrous oxide reductase accessory protein NosL [Myxococcota bacterium]